MSIGFEENQQIRRQKQLSDAKSQNTIGQNRTNNLSKRQETNAVLETWITIRFLTSLSGSKD